MKMTTSFAPISNINLTYADWEELWAILLFIHSLIYENIVNVYFVPDTVRY